MPTLDWIILVLTLAVMVCYGLIKSRGQKGATSYLLANRGLPWYVILPGIMATQASAITFLSTPGLAFNDGMRFVQNYFGLPLAMIVISVAFIPAFSKWKVFTAYEYLESRFDGKTRTLTSALFLLSRGLSTGISIYMPAIILSTILGWNIYMTNLIMGGLLLIYTYAGGAAAVAHTQKVQFSIIMGAMVLAAYLVLHSIPAGIGLDDALYLAGKSGKLNAITTKFDLQDKYNIWSGLIGGFFLALSYFGTDHSQVGRYISGKNARESKLGLLLNGIVKIPMQFFILAIGVLVFVYYTLLPAPPHFNSTAFAHYEQSAPAAAAAMHQQFDLAQHHTRELAGAICKQHSSGAPVDDGQLAEYRTSLGELSRLRTQISDTLYNGTYSPDKNDSNYVFLYFIRHALPPGVAGLLFAVIILASWGSISAALNSLAASSLMDLHLRGSRRTEAEELKLGRWHTLAWGILCIGIAMFAARLGSLIEAVNILGSLFYGTILGIFLVAFFLKKIGGHAVFYAAVIAEVGVVALYCCDIVSFLWLNVIGALLVVALASAAQALTRNRQL